jgi:diacylglycerol kinase (ATP)
MPNTDKNIAILCNAMAGTGRSLSISGQIVASLVKKKIRQSLFIDNWPRHFEGYSDIWIVGGDGTLNYFINQYPDANLPLAVFNGGSGNDFHWLLYAGLGVEEQLTKILVTPARPIDCGLCNDRFFINSAGIGFEGKVVKDLLNSRKFPGKTSYYLTTLKNIFFYRSQLYKISSDKLIAESRKLILSITNGKRVGGSFQVAPMAAPDDGWLDVMMIDAMTPLKRLRYLPVIEKGKHIGLPFERNFKTKQVNIESNQPLLVHLDGEFYTSGRVEIKILPGKFQFRY